MIFVPVMGSKNKKVEVSLDRVGKEEQLVVVFAGKDNDRIDLDLSMIHLKPRTKGRITVKGILRDRATARIRGLVKIEKGAQGADDFLEERTLLLGQEARVESFPYLEIEADDVRASHAATSSPVDEGQLFYLRSRGLSQSEAERLLVAGFLRPAVAEVGDKRLGSKLEKIINYALD
ncbi:MAG: SufD family Fe-S cluster assembly protein [Patescibacteria group bacterium]